MIQEDVFEILKTGQNIFLTGPAGSGKTYLLNKYINYLKDNRVEVAITASTGIAATHLNGRTIHSWCGMRIAEKLNKAQMKALKQNKSVVNRILKARVLIIDEISMLNASRLDLVNNICQAIRQNLKPFGGLQIILCGDFFQLSPVTTKKSEDSRFVVDSDIWNSMDLKVCYIEEQYRQQDKKFLSILSAIRENAIDESIIKILQERYNQPINSSIKPTILYTHNREVEAENLFELNKLKGEEHIYQMAESGLPYLFKSLKDSCLAPETLKLKINAVVMFLKNNFDKGYVNGTLGKVVGFEEDSGYPIVKTIFGKKIIANPCSWAIEEEHHSLASISQIPLRLAWAITVHKSQGMSLDCAEIDLSKTFEFGMGYVALSRVKSLEGIKLMGINEMALQVNKKAIDLDKILSAKSKLDLKNYKKLKNKQVIKDQKDFLKNKDEGIGFASLFGIKF